MLTFPYFVSIGKSYVYIFPLVLKELMVALHAQAANLQNIHCLGEEILASCHPDSIITIKSWISVTKTRYEEVSMMRKIFGQQRCEIQSHWYIWGVSLFCFFNKGSHLGSAATAENWDQFGSTGGRERGDPEINGLDLLSWRSPLPPRPGTSSWNHRAEPGAHSTAHSMTFPFIPHYLLC